MSGKNFDVFISYRHSDGKDKAISLEANFEKAGCRTFRDDNELRRGAFDKRIEIAVLDAPVFVMVLTSDYFQRCNQEGDWVRREIDLAIENGKVIIPINYNGVLKGVPDYLDEEFREKIGCHNFIALHTDTSFKATLREIIDNDIKPNVSIVVNNNNRAKLSVKTDANCELIEDDQIIATLQEGTTKQIFVEKGEHEFIARSTEYNDIEQSIEKFIDDINSKYLLKIELANQVQERKKAIAQKQEAEKDAIKRREEEIKRRQEEEKRRQEEEKRREEEKEKRKQKRKEWWERNKSKLLITLAVIFGIAIIIGLNNSSLGETDTPTETATETITKTQTIIPVVENVTSINNNEDSIRKAKEQKKEEERKLKEEQKKKKRDEEKFKEYKKKGDDYYLLLVGNPDNKDYKDQAKYYYGLALQYKEDITIRNRFEKLKR